MLSKIFKELGIAELTQKVFDVLFNNGPLTAKQISDKLGIPRPSVYDHLKFLIQRDLVSEKVVDGKKVFLVGGLKSIQDLLDEKIRLLQDEKKNFEESLKILMNKVSFFEPQIKFYSGREGVRQALSHIMTNRNIETELFWPMSEMMNVLGGEYLEDLNIKRVERNIFLRAIWPKDKTLDFKKYPYLAGGDENLRELRFAPKGMTWSMGYWMYEDRVVFLSSEKEGFSFVVKSKEFSDLLRLHFEQMWVLCDSKISKK